MSECLNVKIEKYKNNYLNLQIMGQKEEFIAQMKVRTRKFGVDVIKFVETVKPCKAANPIIYQIVKSSTSVGANYRACCRARSQNEFFSKICIVVEEADESEFWLEVILEANLSTDEIELQRLLTEASELIKITAAAKNSTYNSKK